MTDERYGGGFLGLGNECIWIIIAIIVICCCCGGFGIGGCGGYYKD